jgi:NodT family efflux transporter outer membrane factor (OMF) lipoprotein
MRRLSRLIAAGPLLLAGCNVGPDYVKPSVDVTLAYKEQPPTETGAHADKTAGIWRRAHPSDNAIRTNWWEAFGDEELDVLERQVGVANQDLKAAAARFSAARALVDFARTGEFPTIGIGSDVASLRDSLNAPYAPSQISSRPTGDFSLTADISYEVDLCGRVRRGVTAATKEAQVSAADLGTAKLSLQAELALDYFNLRSADAQQRLLDDTITSYQDSLHLAQDRLEGGAAPASDVAQAKTQFDTARVQDTDIAVARAQYEHAIAVLVGKPPAQFTLASSPLEFAPPRIPAGLPSERSRTQARHRGRGTAC